MAERDPVVIVGAGPVGLALALGLARHGTPCRILDRDAGPSEISRATEVHARTLEVLDLLGAAGGFVERGLPMRAMSFVSHGRRVAHWALGGVDSPFPARMALPQRDTERILIRELEALGITVERQCTLVGLAQDPDGVSARFRDPDGREASVRGGWLVGCDGFHSAVRELSGVSFAGKDYPGVWGAVDARIDGWPYPLDEITVFLEDGGLFAMALPGGSMRLSFRYDGAEPVPTPGYTQAVVDRHTAGGARIREAIAPAVYRIHFRVAERFHAGRVLLAGDAAHVCSPAGGEGMNTGIQDAANLAWKLALVTAGRAPASLMESYETERRSVDVAAATASDAAQGGMSLAGPAEERGRDRALAVRFATPVAQLVATEESADLLAHYRQSPIVGGDRAGGASGEQTAWVGPAPGERVPDAGPLIAAGGAETRLRELLRGPRHALLILAGGADRPTLEGYARLLRPSLAELGALATAHLVVVADEPPPPIANVSVLADPQLALHGRLGAGADTLYLIRPDGYLGYRGEPPDPGALQGHLRRTFA